jgi:hypothetical protein
MALDSLEMKLRCAKWSQRCHTSAENWHSTDQRTPRHVVVEEVFPMPRYYFHVKRGQVTVLDHEGAELLDLAEAEKEALRRAQEIVARDGPMIKGSIIVADDNWRTLYEVPF